MHLRSHDPESARFRDGLYVELVGLLFSGIFPIAAIGITAGIVSILVANRTDDVLTSGLGAAAVVVAVARAGIVIGFRRGGPATGRSLADVVAWERLFAAGSYGLAALIGALATRAFRLDDPVAHMLATALLVGYGSGLVARVSLRPWICVPSLLIAVVPTVISVGARPDLSYLGHAVLLAGFCATSLEMVRHLYRTTRDELTTRRELAGLARHDSLTGLPNRLAMRETLEHDLRARRSLAVLFLDLDHFKAVNDRLGHPVGDKVLVEVARRLLELVRATDMVARIGGDEFVVIQSGLRHPDEAEMLARRIVRTLSAPYSVHGRDIRIGASVGIALSQPDSSRGEDLIGRADQALYTAKQRGRNGFALAS